MAAREMFMTAAILRLTKLCGGERAGGNGVSFGSFCQKLNYKFGRLKPTYWVWVEVC